MLDINFIIINDKLEPNRDLIPLLFGDEPCIETSARDMYDILVLAQVFKSRSDARKNWTRFSEIPDGFSIWDRIGKTKGQITIWKPIGFFA